MIFWIALNLVLTLAVARSRRELSESSGIIEKGAICVELGSFYWKKRILVRMQGIVFRDLLFCIFVVALTKYKLIALTKNKLIALTKIRKFKGLRPTRRPSK